MGYTDRSNADGFVISVGRYLSVLIAGSFFPSVGKRG